MAHFPLQEVVFWSDACLRLSIRSMYPRRQLCEVCGDPSSSCSKRKTRTDQVNARFHCSELGSTKNLSTLGCSHRSSSLEAFPAKYRSPLCGPEGNRGFLSALRACGLRFGSRLSGSATSSALGALCLTGLAPLWLVLEPFVGEKHLLAGCKYELGTAFRTLQDSIVEFHEHSP